MKKIIFILPYFGKFNNYFQLFLNSCKMNPDFTWLIYTDDKTNYEYPNNVIVKYRSYDEFNNMISNRLNVSLIKPYKLCDFRPCYGFLFENDIKGYDYWGYCDCDLIYGNLKKFINDKTLGDLDKLGVLGHMSLIKNNQDNNCLFKKNINYFNILSSEKSCHFDELFVDSFNNLFEESGKKIKQFYDFADIYTKSSHFLLTTFNGRTVYDFDVDKEKKDLFIWENGSLYSFYESDNSIKMNEYAYIHLQKREMAVASNINYSYYKIIPNTIENLEYNVDDLKNKSIYKKIKKYHINLHYFKLRYKNLKFKIKEKI